MPIQIVQPIETLVVDSETGEPIEGATIVRIVCDIHDYGCEHAKIDRGRSNQAGRVVLEGQSEWGIWMPAPGGLPVPSHQIAIWKEGYVAFTFSQYDLTIDEFEDSVKNKKVLQALNEIPANRMHIFDRGKASQVLNGGKVKLDRIDNKQRVEIK